MDNSGKIMLLFYYYMSGPFMILCSCRFLGTTEHVQNNKKSVSICNALIWSVNQNSILQTFLNNILQLITVVFCTQPSEKNPLSVLIWTESLSLSLSLFLPLTFVVQQSLKNCKIKAGGQRPQGRAISGLKPLFHLLGLCLHSFQEQYIIFFQKNE